MLTTNSSMGVTPEVNLKNALCAGNKTVKTFKVQGRHHQKPKIGVSVAPQKDSIFLKKLQEKIYGLKLNVHRNAPTVYLQNTKLHVVRITVLHF